MVPSDLLADVSALLALCRARQLKIATAESCTGGLIAALLTEIAGSSDVFDRGFVTYSNAAKTEMLGVPASLIQAHGAVSEPVARGMAEGALRHSAADIGLSVTGIAGPGGGSTQKPVGLVHLALARRTAPTLHKRLLLGDIGRAEVRLQTARTGIDMLGEAARNP